MGAFIGECVVTRTSAETLSATCRRCSAKRRGVSPLHDTSSPPPDPRPAHGTSAEIDSPTSPTRQATTSQGATLTLRSDRRSLVPFVTEGAMDKERLAGNEAGVG